MSIYLILLFVFMVVGILSGYAVSVTVVCVFLTLFFLLCYLKLPYERVLMAMALGLLLGWVSLFLFHQGTDRLPYNQTVTLVGEIVEIKDDRYATLAVWEVEGQRVSGIKLRLSTWHPVGWSLGQVTQIEGALEEIPLATNPSQGNFRYIYYGKGISGRLSVETYQVLENMSGNKLFRFRTLIQGHIVNRVSKGLDSVYKGLALGMSIGDKSLLSKEDEEGLRNLGLSHILVVSSLHVGLLLVVVNDLSTRLSLSMKWRHTIIILLMMLLLVVSASIVSLVKCFFIYSAHLIGAYYNRKPFYLLSLAVYGLCALMYNPYYLYNLSFTLSLMAYVGVFVLYRYTWRQCPKYLNPWYITLCIYGVLMPIFIYNFKGLHYLGLFVTPLLMPSLEIVIVANFLNTFIQSVYRIPFISSLLEKLLKLIRMVIVISQKLGEHFILIPNMVPFLIFVFYLILLVGILKSYKVVKAKIFYGLLACSMVIYLIVWGMNYFPLSVYYLDVGMGDGALLYCQGQSVLIDGGTPYNKTIIENVMRGIGEKSVDIAIVSHEHKDHYGGIVGLMEERAVKKVYMTEAALKALKPLHKEVFLTYEEWGQLLILSEDVVHPFKDDWQLKLYGPDENEEDPNNHSIIVMLQKGEMEFLFTGDAEREEEEKILSKVLEEAKGSIDFLKVPHHGSRTSSTESFLLAAQPNYGIISVGQNNRYGLPDEEVIERYEAMGTQLHRTDENGALVVHVFKDWIWYEDY